MLKLLKKILKLASIAINQNKIYLLSLMIFTNFFLELFGIVLFIPIISYILNSSLNYLKFDNPILDYFSENFFLLDSLGELGGLYFLLCLLIIIFCCKLIFSLIFNYFITKFSFQVQRDLGDNLFDLYLEKNYLDFISSHSAEKIRNINFNTNYYSSGLIAFSSLISEILMFFGLFIILVYVNFIVTLFTSITLLFLIFIYYFLFKKKLDNWSEASNIQAAVKLKNLTETFNSFKEILIYSSKNYFKDKFRKSNIDSLNPYRKFTFLSMSFKPIVEIIFVIMIVSAIIYILSFKLDQNFILNNLIFFVVILSRLIPSVNRINANLQRLKFCKNPIESIYDLLNNSKNEYDRNIKIEKNNSNDIEFNNDIKMSNISYTYKDTKVLDKLNFKIKKGEKIGIHGNSGCGKTTFLDLLVGLIKSDGKIFCDEIEVNVKNINWSKKFSYIPQNFYLLDDTIKSNILFGSNDNKTKIERLKKSIGIAQLDKLIIDLKNGLDTIVGEDGTKLSGGQKQRIALARAFYRNPEIIILDEPTSSLDINTAQALIDSVLKFSDKITIIIVSHDKNILKKMDKIYKFIDGKILKDEI